MKNVLKRGQSVPRWTRFAVAGLFAAVLAGCGGSDGATGPAGAAGANGKDVDPTVVNNLTAQITALTQATNPETCVACHTGATPVAASGAMHQASYAKLYQDGVIKVSDMAFSAVGTTATLTFKMTNAGANFDCTKSSDFTIGSSWVRYDSASQTFPNDTASYTYSLIGTKAWDAATNTCTITKTGVPAADVTLMAGDGVVVVYGVDGIVSNDPVTHFIQGNRPFAGVLKIGTVDYSSAANVDSCSTCHTTPYLKHGYIYGKVTDNGGTPTQFMVCKACHTDTGTGGHQFWQILQDAKDAVDAAKANPTNTALATKAKTLGDRAAAINGGAALTDAEKAKYAYNKKLMNDVHMSHGMEFPYPQSMQNCATCHAGKESVIFAANKFKAETCISCHSVDGIKAKMTASGFGHATQVASETALRNSTCSTCHNGADAPTSATIHSGGYNPKIAATDGTRYAWDPVKSPTAIKPQIGAVTFDSATNKLNIKVTAEGAVGAVKAENIVPTFLVGLYGYDSKDFLVPAHGTHPAGGRNLEAAWGTTNARFTWAGTTPVTANGVTTWEATVDLSTWADKIASGAIKRAEIAMMPTLKHPTLEDPASTTTPKAKLTLALNAPSKTFNLATKAFVTSSAIIPTGATTCNSCHDALGTTFHSGDRGGNIAVCRICHEVSSPGSHLELQSRSIDSYVHAIHSFQAFDISGLDMTDAFTAMEYKAHTGTDYPKFGITNCESCHAPGTYDVPNQAKSMPGVASKSSAFKAGTRNIGTVPQVVTGPAARACGSCHVSQAINANAGLGDSTKLAILNSHIKQNGYQVDASAYSSSTTPKLFDLWTSITGKLMAMFK